MRGSSSALGLAASTASHCESEADQSTGLPGSGQGMLTGMLTKSTPAPAASRTWSAKQSPGAPRKTKLCPGR